MDIFSILIKKRDYEFPATVAACAERFTANNARQSSYFQLALADVLVAELDERCRLFFECKNNWSNFDEFFTTQESDLRGGLKARFGVSVPGKERCELLREEYRESHRPLPPKPQIGFHA
jgi:hypothetical protein